MKKKKSYLAEMITIVVVVAILVVLMVFMVRGSKTDDSKFIPNDYYEKYVAQGKLEKQYQYPSNDIRVFSEDFDVDGGNLTKISYYVPEILNDEDKYPVVIFVNEDGKDVESYDAILKHLASYGFICVGSNDRDASSGESTKYVYDHITYMNNSSDEYLYNHIDLENIGIYGFVHGGIGSLNAISNYNVPCDALVTLSMPSLSFLEEEEFEYIYDPTKINTNWFIGNTEGKNELLFNSTEDTLELLDMTPSSAMMATRNNIDYGSAMGCFDAYVTIYYIINLKQNEELKPVFEEEGEFSKNSLFTNFNKNY